LPEIHEMKNLLVLLLLITSFTVNAQTKSHEYKKVDEIIKKYSVPIDNDAIISVARFIYENFSSETEKLRAIYVWLAENFEYDVENMFNLKTYADKQEVIDEMINKKKGVCMHFAFLFKEIGEILGVKSHIIQGFTKQNGIIVEFPHAWCTSFTDSTWVLIDPTWGAGHIINGKEYVKKLNNDYFMSKPEKLVQSHFPYDPLWQFLNFPVSIQDFYDSKTEINKDKPFFNYPDTLLAYEKGTRMEQLISTNRRIIETGVINPLIKTHLENNEKEIDLYKQQMAVERFNLAANYFNDGVKYLNEFIAYRNNQFTPQKTETETRAMVEKAENELLKARNELQNITTTDKNMIDMIIQLQNSILEIAKQLYEHKSFINRYFDTTNPSQRKSLFYQ